MTSRVAEFIASGFTAVVIQNAHEQPYLDGFIYSFALYLQCLIQNFDVKESISLIWQIVFPLVKFVIYLSTWSLECTLRLLSFVEGFISVLMISHVGSTTN